MIRENFGRIVNIGSVQLNYYLKGMQFMHRVKALLKLLQRYLGKKL